jgi:dephospho-CoA kinase
MLRVGLTGGVGSGKSAVALVWAATGVPVLEADALGRALMQPGERVHAAIVDAFGTGMMRPDGQLDRAALAREAFAGGRLKELNAIVHPAVIIAQEEKLRELAAEGEHALAVVESALIFEASGEALGEASGEALEAPFEKVSPELQPTVPGWRERFSKLVLVAAPAAVRVERFVARAGGPDAGEAEKSQLRDDARRRMAAQLPDEWKRSRCDYVIENDRTLVLLRREALQVLDCLRHDA